MKTVSTTEANVALVQTMYDAFFRGDMATILGGMTPDIDWQSIGPAKDFPAFTPQRGTAGAERFFHDIQDAFTFTEFTPREFIASGDKVVCLGHYAMTFKKSGRKAATDWAHVFTIRDGKVSQFREHTDSAKFVEAYRG